MKAVSEPIRIAISACLLGKEVRFDGGHKHDHFLTDGFGRYVEWVPFCPEVEIGMGIPREPVRLVRVDGAFRLVGTRSLEDWSERMRRHTRKRVKGLGDVHGVVFKKDSPTCGMLRVKVYPEGALHGQKDLGSPGRDGVGLFASAYLEAHPLIPAEEEGRLNDARLRENFVERVFAYRRLRTLLDERFSVGRLVAFHAAHKYQLLAHSPVGYKELGKLVARAKEVKVSELKEAYAAGFMKALAAPATKRRNTNVLEHILGHFKKLISAGDKEEALALIRDYQHGLVPLVVPLTLLQHFLRQSEDAWLAAQTYLQPHPKELMLRNHV